MRSQIAPRREAARPLLRHAEQTVRGADRPVTVDTMISLAPSWNATTTSRASRTATTVPSRRLSPISKAKKPSRRCRTRSRPFRRIRPHHVRLDAHRPFGHVSASDTPHTASIPHRPLFRVATPLNDPLCSTDRPHIPRVPSPQLDPLRIPRIQVQRAGDGPAGR